MDKQDFDQWAEDRRRRRRERESRRAERRGAERESNGRETSERRKEKVLHTRISETLDETLRSAANELRVPVSNLVRNVLEDVFDVVETVTENVEDLVEDLMDEAGRVRQSFGRRRRYRPRTRTGFEEVDITPEGKAAEVVDLDEERPEFPDVVGWQPLFLNTGQQCGDCGRDLAKGDRAFVGLDKSGAPLAWLCRDCLEARR